MSGYDSTANMPGQLGPPFMEPATACSSPCYDASFEKRQPFEFSSNDLSSIGSNLQLDKTQGVEEDPFIDRVFSPYLSTDVRHDLNSKAASQMSSENCFLPFSPNMFADESVPSALLTTRGNANSPYCDVAVTGRAVMPSNTTTWLTSKMNFSFIWPYCP